MNVKSLMLRSVSGLIYIAVIIGSIFLGEIALYCLGGLLAILASVEFYRITHAADMQSDLPGLFIDIASTLCLAWLTLGYPILFFIALLLIRLALQLYSRSTTPIRNISLSLMGMVYIGIPLGCMLFIPFMRFSAMPLLAIFIMIWLNDTGAFLVGSMLGKHRLFERISPKKSWEGFIGGLIFNLVFSLVIALTCPKYFALDIGTGFWIGLGLLVTVAATYGDLFESLLKRNLHIKDSGNIIPGHGGILDRIDSLLFVMPASMLYILLFELCDFSRTLIH